MSYPPPPPPLKRFCPQNRTKKITEGIYLTYHFLKGICHSLFVIMRTQLNLNKIVISKQYKESHNGTNVRKGTKPASKVLKIIQAGRSSFQ